MNEYLRIQNFGPVVDIELDNIVPLTVLIGESGSGKSTVMKVLSMFRWIYKRVVLRSYVRKKNRYRYSDENFIGNIAVE